MTEAERLVLIRYGELREIIGVVDDFEQILLLAVRQQFFQFGMGPKMVKCERPAGAEDQDDLFDAGAVSSSTTIWRAGVSTTGSSSFGMTFEAGSIRVPIPAATITALVTFIRKLSEQPARLITEKRGIRQSCALWALAGFLIGLAAYT